MTEHEEA